jgi:putative hydrolase of the HAD superfamily
MARYTTILFDMFDTLVRFDRTRLPAARIGGREVRSSVPVLHALAADDWPGVDLETFYAAFLWAYEESERIRAATHREVPARERFGLFYRRVGMIPDAVPPALTERLLATHMRCLAGAAEPMVGLVDLLDWLGGRYRLGVVSNFDYTPTVHHILAEGGILSRFDAVVVSDAVGWRKPHRVIFETALATLGVRAEECLFVGDRPEIDVAGAKAMGMGAAWLNPAGSPWPADLPAPDFDIGGLAELRQVLEMAARTPLTGEPPLR